ncbi:MAG: undecaprenyl-diphosphate phosphatase [Finegoldia magna]|uniref:Undecaprenyl-diphosphatase n=1 Tax=Finegoldia magna TaxID=1260 RepID=A0A943LHX8_FINMA|nr:undecaprenyl-diphosphate phosphatase [Finegoldia magna]MBS5965114.1 undecaprenyl-diphosphate phosphatase [Finegoldia magna]
MFIEILKVILLGIIEGVTEWLPVSSTGHILLLDEFIKLNMSDAFKSMFTVVIQLGAILAVVVIYWNEVWPFKKGQTHLISISKSKMIMWVKIIVACIPAAIIGIKFDDFIEEHFYNYFVISLALIIFGILFIIIENKNKESHKKLVDSIDKITYKQAFIVGLFQVIAAVFPGTSRSGATILGGIAIGLSRTIAAEFTFFLAIPTMFGASLLKLVKFGFSFTAMEGFALLLGTAVSFIVSVITIKFLMNYIKNNDFKVFGYYRIALGVLVLIYFGLIR